MGRVATCHIGDTEQTRYKPLHKFYARQEPARTVQSETSTSLAEDAEATPHQRAQHLLPH